MVLGRLGDDIDVSTLSFVDRCAQSIARTIESVGLRVTPFHAYVPAFGEWGFTLATRQPWQAPDRYPPGLRFLTPDTVATLLRFPPDMGPVTTEINRRFNADWNELPFAPDQESPLLVSPFNSRQKMEMLLENARESIQIADAKLTDPAIIRLLVKKARSGIPIRVLERTDSVD